MTAQDRFNSADLASIDRSCTCIATHVAIDRRLDVGVRLIPSFCIRELRLYAADRDGHRGIEADELI
jgi:hypothetical protein